MLLMYPKLGIAMASPGLPPGRTRPLAGFSVQRASVSFCPTLAGFSGHIFPALLPASFLASGRGVALLVRHHGRGIDDRSPHRQIAALAQLPFERGEQRIEHARARQRLAEQLERVLVRCDCAQAKPRNRSQLSRSRLRNCMRASLTVICAARIRTLNMATGPYGRDHPSPGRRNPAPCQRRPNTSKFTARLIVSSGGRPGSRQGIEGTQLRILAAVDAFSRLSPALVPRFSFKARDVVEVLDRVCGKWTIQRRRRRSGSCSRVRSTCRLTPATPPSISAGRVNRRTRML